MRTVRDGYKAESHADRSEQCRDLLGKTVYALRFCLDVLYESTGRGFGRAIMLIPSENNLREGYMASSGLGL